MTQGLTGVRDSHTLLEDMKQLQSLGRIIRSARAQRAGPGGDCESSHADLDFHRWDGVGDAASGARVASIKQLTKLALNHDRSTDAGFALRWPITGPGDADVFAADDAAADG